MLKRLFLYFSVAFILVVFATWTNRSFLEKKKTVVQLFHETTDRLRPDVVQSPSATPETFSKNQDGATQVNPQFLQWFESEASLVDSSRLNTQAKEEELRAVASQLSPQAVDFLKDKSLSLTRSQSERLLSIYLLTLGGAATQQALVEIASQNLNLESAEPHTLDEIKNNQLRASQIMAIDAVAESSRELQEKLRDLQTISSRSRDEFVKGYAQRKQDELRSQ